MKHLFYQSDRKATIIFWVVTLALVSGFVLAILSWLEICVEHCSANQDYRLFSFPFAPVGIVFFAGLISLHFFSNYFNSCKPLLGWALSIALGAELMFIMVQKYQIGHWCPLCLSIALCLGVAGLALSYDYSKSLYMINQYSNRGEIVNKIKTGLGSLSLFMLGFLLAFIGVTKVDPVQAEIESIKNRLVMGDKNSSVEVYFVTDWYCPSCRKIEPQMEEILPQIEAKAAFYFIDYPIHSKSLNFSPYNLTFLLTDKPSYLKAHRMLSELAEETDTPRDLDVIKAAKKMGIPYKEVSFLEIKQGMDFFNSIVEQYKLDSTPIVIIANRNTKKFVILDGTDEIKPKKVLEEIDKMKS